MSVDRDGLTRRGYRQSDARPRSPVGCKLMPAHPTTVAFLVAVALGGMLAVTSTASALPRVLPPHGGTPASTSPPQATGGRGREHVPGSRVNKRAAAAWALANVSGGYIFPDDCTNFVSEALDYGGGDPQTSPVSSTDDHYWWFFFFRFGIRYSLSWAVAHDLAVHLNLIHSYWIRYWRDARPGDVIFADWKRSSFAGISHVGIITGMRNGQPLITQHSPSQRNIPLQYWLRHGGPDVHVWIAVPNLS